MASVCPKSISEIHRHKEAVDDRLVPAGVVAVEDPVVAVLARQRVPGRNAIAVAVDHVIVVRYPMDLVGTKMVGVGRPAAGGLHPGRHGLPIGPDLMGFGAAADEAEAENEWKDVDPRFHLAFSAQRIRGGLLAYHPLWTKLRRRPDGRPFVHKRNRPDAAEFRREGPQPQYERTFWGRDALSCPRMRSL